jgi:hypothetical protein
MSEVRYPKPVPIEARASPETVPITFAHQWTCNYPCNVVEFLRCGSTCSVASAVRPAQSHNTPSLRELLLSDRPAENARVLWYGADLTTSGEVRRFEQAFHHCMERMITNPEARMRAG